MARTAHRRLLAASLAAVAATPVLSGTAPPTHWAAPLSGSFYNPANWSDGVSPVSGAPAIINATGAAYTVGWSAAAVGLPRVSSVLLDSPDATILYRSINQFSGDAITGDFIVRRGALDFQGRLAGPGTLRIENGTTFDIRADTQFLNYPITVLSLAVSNEGLTTIRGDGVLSQGFTGSGSIPGSIRIDNKQSGVMRFEGGNFFYAGTLNNHGLIEILNDPQFGGPDSPLEIDGTAFGRVDFVDSTPAVFNNHGAVQIQRGNLRIEGSGLHSGSFEMLSPDSVLSFRGDHAFLPGTTISGAGLTRFNHSGAITGAISIEGDAMIERVFNTSTTIDAALDVGGTLTLDFDFPSLRFGSSIRAGVITGDLDRDFVFAGPSDIAFSGAVRSAEFLAPTIIRGDIGSTAAVTRFHGPADISGSVSNAIFMGAAAIEGSAERVEFQRGASVGGNLTGYANAIGAVSVGGDLVTTAGSWSFLDGTGPSLPTRLDVAGDVMISRNFTVQGILNAGGDFSATIGNFETITADTVRFGSPTSTVSLGIGIRSGSQILAREGRAIIQRAQIVATSGNSSPGAEFVTFASGFEVIYNPITPFTRAGFLVNVDADALNATTFHFLADSALAGTLDVAVFGDASSLSFGDSFTILEGRVVHGSTDPLPTITGEFDRLFLPSLPGDLFFDVVYEPSAVRLVVVPAPGGIATLAGIGALALTRRRARTVTMAATLAAIAGTSALAGPTTAHWAAPVSGGFYDPANWDDGIGPATGADMIIDAAGQPYIVDWPAAIGVPRVNSFLLDSHDARVVMRGGRGINNTDFRVAGDTVIRRGVLDLNGQIFGTGALRIEAGGTLDIQNGHSGDGFRGAQLALDVFNEGQVIVRGGAMLSQIRTSGVFPDGIRIINEESAIMRFEGGNLFTAGALDNHGLIVLENDPQFNGAPPLNTVGTAFGPLDHQPTLFNNYGAVRVEQGQFLLGGSGVHTGRFELQTADSVFVLAGDHTFMPGSRITGPGTTRLNRFGSLGGALSVEGDFELETINSPINASLDIGGDFALIGNTIDIEFSEQVRAGTLSGTDNKNLIFFAEVDLAFTPSPSSVYPNSVVFHAPAIIRSSLAAQAGIEFRDSAFIEGGVRNAVFRDAAIVLGNASQSFFEQGASVGSLLQGVSGSTSAFGRVDVAGDLEVRTIGSTFRDGGPGLEAALNIGGDARILAPNFLVEGPTTVQGSFFAYGGRFEDITADTISIGSSLVSSSGGIRFASGSRLDAGNHRVVIQRTQVAAGNVPPGSETVTFATGFEVIYNPITPFTRAGFLVNVDADALNATTFHFLADSALAGTLDVAVFGDASSLSFGDSFTILEGRVVHGSTDPLPTITGEFDRLFLPSLPGDLFFDVVYEPSAVRLVVVPAPGAGLTLAFAGVVNTRRTRRISVLT